MNSGEFHSHVTKIAKRCQFPNAQASGGKSHQGCNIFGHEQSKCKGQGHKPHE